MRNNAKITTPLVEKEGKTVTDYEYLFSMNLQAKLKEKIQGAIYVKVNENDSLVIKVTRRDGNNFDMSFTDFANRMLNGLTTDYTAYEVVQKYKKFVMTQFSNELKDSALNTLGLLILFRLEENHDCKKI